MLWDCFCNRGLRQFFTDINQKHGRRKAKILNRMFWVEKNKIVAAQAIWRSWVRNWRGSPYERGSTFGTVFLDCPKSRPSFYLQSLAIQGFCRDKLLVRIWTLKYKQLKMAIEAAENLESEPLFPEIELLLFPKKCVLILLWRLKV